MIFPFSNNDDLAKKSLFLEKIRHGQQIKKQGITIILYFLMTLLLIRNLFYFVRENKIHVIMRVARRQKKFNLSLTAYNKSQILTTVFSYLITY